MRDDQGGGDDRDDDPGREDREAGAAAPVAECVPEPEDRDDEADLLLRQARRSGAECEGDEAPLVEVPDREEEKRGRERDRMEVVDDEPLRRRVEQVDEREREPLPLPAEMLSGEPEHWQRPESDT